MTNLMERSVRRFALIKAARELKKEMEKAGLDTLKILAENGVSIIDTYLKACSPQEKAKYKQKFNILLRLEITPDMVLSELARQMPELTPIMDGREDYKKREVQKLEAFLKEA